MANIKSTKLKLGFKIDEDGKLKNKSKTIQNISSEALDENLIAVADNLYALIDGTAEETTKIVETLLA
ncbi:MAG: DUF1659 domain-containing protein [Lagierella massiliensis]|nr:DUF1659 domain-containing protein [Lagierella massiliensis]